MNKRNNTTSIIEGRNNIIIYADHAEIEIISKGITTYVQISLEDVNKVKEHRWFITQGYTNSAVVGSLHRFLINPDRGYVVDHIDRNKLNNRRENLRAISPIANSMNRSDSQFPVAGISVTPSNKYRVRLRYKEVCVLDKTFNTANEAIKARLIAEIENCFDINHKLYSIYLSPEEIEAATLRAAINNFYGKALNKDKKAAINLLNNRPIITNI